eukprot:3478766-Amphidinium_carterae.1
MPNSKGSVNCRAGSFISLVGTLFKVSQSLGAKTGFQARKVRSLGRYLSKQRLGRVPFDLQICFMPSEDLLPTCHPSGWAPNSVRQSFKVSDGPPSSSFTECIVPYALFKRPLQSASVQFLCHTPMVFKSAVTCRSPAGPP